LVLDENFIEKMFFGDMLHPLTDTERYIYRARYAGNREARWPMLSWPAKFPLTVIRLIHTRSSRLMRDGWRASLVRPPSMSG
jgi:hypothetical protein